MRSGMVADGNVDGSIDVLDLNGFVQVLLGLVGLQFCPSRTSVASAVSLLFK